LQAAHPLFFSYVSRDYNLRGAAQQPDFHRRGRASDGRDAHRQGHGAQGAARGRWQRHRGLRGLFEKFEDKLGAHRGQLRRAAVELAKDWRTDRVLRRLEALMIVASRDEMFLLSGNGDVIEPDEGVAAIGSGGTFAQSAAIALMRHTEMSAKEIAEAALGIAASICIYTNSNISVESIE